MLGRPRVPFRSTRGVVAEQPAGLAEDQGHPLMRDQIGNGLTGPGDRDSLAGLDPLQQARQRGLGLVDVDLGHGTLRGGLT